MRQLPVRAGPFVLDRRIGRGGSGTVWEAHHEHSRALVAIKLLRDGAVDPALVDLETAALARLAHPNIVRLFDRGQLEEGSIDHPAGTHWLAMELAQKTSFGLLKEFEWERVIPLVRQVLWALAYAHSQGVLHRDVKPGNLLLFESATPTWKLADFGIAQPQHAPTLHLGGSPSFSPPEQSSERSDQGPWTDLYAFGLTLWQLCTGKKVPWHDQDGVRRHLLPPFAPRFATPPDLALWLHWLTHPEPHRRPQRVADAAHAFEEILAGGAFTSAARAALPVAPPPPHRTPSELLQGVGLRMFGQRRVAFVGREQERKALWSVLIDASKRCRVRSVRLTGPPGSGKSRTAHWFARTAHALGAHALLLDPQRPDLALRNLLGSGAPSVVEHFANRHALHPIDRHGLRTLAQRTSAPDVASLVAAIAVASTERPVVVVLDNEADWPQAVVQTLKDRLPDRAVVVVHTGPELDGDQNLPLPPMPPEEMEQLLDQTLPLEATLRSFLREHAHGLPGRPMTWLRRWAANDELHLGRHGIERDGGLPDRSPPIAAELQGQRVYDLLRAVPAEEHALLALLAVLGPTVERDWLAPLERRHGPVLHELVMRGHVVPHRQTWRFRDPSFHDALLAALSDLPAAHDRAAGLLQATGGPLHRIGLHLHRAGWHEEAFRPLLDGSDELRVRGEPRFEIVEAARQALEATENPDVTWPIAFQRHLGQVLRQLGQAAQGVEALSESVRLARRAGADGQLARSLASLATNRAMTGDAADLNPLFAEAQDLARQDAAMLAVIHVSWSEYLVFRGEHQRVLDELPRHLPHLEDDARSSAHVALGRAASHLGDLDTAMNHALQARVIASEVHARSGVVMGNFLLGEVHLQRGEPEAALAFLEEARSLARHATSSELAIAGINVAFALCRLERWTEALEAGTEGWTLARRFGWRTMELMGRAITLWPLAALGHDEAFEEQLLCCQPLSTERLSSWETSEALLRAHRLLPEDASPRKHCLELLAQATAEHLPEGPLRDDLRALSLEGADTLSD